METLLKFFLWLRGKAKLFGKYVMLMNSPSHLSLNKQRLCLKFLHALAHLSQWWGKGLNTGLGSRNSRLLILVLTLTSLTFGCSFCYSLSVPRFVFRKESILSPRVSCECLLILAQWFSN